jgi:hypothetical protein
MFGVCPITKLSLLQTYYVESHVNLQDAAKEFVKAGRGAR